MEGVTYQSLGNALKALRVAEDELSRPVEDVVTACSCQFTRMALNGFLRTFLLHVQSTVDPALNSDELLALCSKVDPGFSSVNLSSFACRNQPGEAGVDKMYCLHVDKVNECLNTTRTIKDLVLARLQVSEIDIL